MTRVRSSLAALAALTVVFLAASVNAGYTNFEASQVHPIGLTPSGARLLVLNTPDALLEVFAVAPDGRLTPGAAIPVGLEPTSVRARTNSEAWVVNQLSDSVSIVDLDRGAVVDTLRVGDEPSDVAFAGGKVYVTVAGEDVVKSWTLADLDASPTLIPIFSRRPRALAVAPGGASLYVVALQSGNQTTVVNANSIFGTGIGIDPLRAVALGIDDMTCSTPPPAYPPLPAGISRNPTLPDPPAGGVPHVGLIVGWNAAAGTWTDEVGANWSPCLPFRLPDQDLFVIDVASDTVAVEVAGVGTSLFDVAVNPASGLVYVPNTEARNLVRFEHPLGVRGHIVDNRLTVLDPSAAWGTIATLDLNTHIDRRSDPATNLAERMASISQPGMLVWTADGSRGYLTGIGTRKLFEVDGTCTSGGACVFGPDRRVPRAVEVGDGPTGVALHEASGTLYVLNRFANSIAIVERASLTKTGEVGLHDPSSRTVLDGRRFLYDAIDGSGHGDAACSTCHISGDLDGLAWDLGDPTGAYEGYAVPSDNVRFIFPLGGVPNPCDPILTPGCASHQGFDPQKGPMTTQTLRGMLEPLHWRGDRPTFNAFNPAFVGLMGTADRGPVAGKPAGLTAADMERFRQFALDLPFPPNPFRNVDDTLPSVEVPIVGTAHAGNPADGALLFDTFPSDGGQPCTACHAHPFGAAGGKLGGVTPLPATSPDAAALFNGDADLSPHNDLKVAHLRNIYTKVGHAYGVGAPAQVRSGFGLVHDGSVPDMLTFLSINVFTLSDVNAAEQVRDLSAFVQGFPTGTPPCVGQSVTLPGTAADDALLATLLAIADLADPLRHGELVAYGPFTGGLRNFHLDGGLWVTDIAGELPLSTAGLRAAASGPVTFMCTPIGSGTRLGGDRDEDTHKNGDDCADHDPATWSPTTTVSNLFVTPGSPTAFVWDAQSTPGLGPDLAYEIVGGLLSALRSSGLAATDCVKGDVPAATWDDARGAPPVGDGYYYFVRARNSCGAGDFGPGRASIESLDCRGR